MPEIDSRPALTYVCVLVLNVTDYNRNVIHSYYGEATTIRLLKLIGLFCKRALQKRLYSAKEDYTFKEPTNHSHHICRALQAYMYKYMHT